MYGDELKRATVNSKEAFNVALPLKDHPIASPLTVGRWDNENEKWTQVYINKFFYNLVKNLLYFLQYMKSLITARILRFIKF